MIFLSVLHVSLDNKGANTRFLTTISWTYKGQDRQLNHSGTKEVLNNREFLVGEPSCDWLSAAYFLFVLFISIKHAD